MRTLSIKNTDEVIQEAIKVLTSGGLIIFPTETAYGVGADATNAEAITKLLSYKQRPVGKAISIAVSSKEMTDEYIEINQTANNIIKNFLPGPITVVAESKHKVDSRLEAENGTIGIRIPNYKLVLDIINAFGKPITATSANLSGGKTPYSIEDITSSWTENKKSMIDLIIDGGELPKNPPSTVIDTTTDDLKVYRQGRIDPRKMTKFEIRNSNSAEETIKFAEEFTNKVKERPLVILLSGELGAGKTHFTKGIGKALGIEQMIKSPTYTYVSEYKFGENKLFHFDAWRIQTKQDLEALRFYDWFKDGNVIVVEWPSVAMALDENFFENLNYYYVDFVILDNNKREIKIFKNGSR